MERHFIICVSWKQNVEEEEGDFFVHALPSLSFIIIIVISSFIIMAAREGGVTVMFASFFRTARSHIRHEREK